MCPPRILTTPMKDRGPGSRRDRSGVRPKQINLYAKEDFAMLKKARIVSMIVLAASIVVTAGLAVENLVLAVIALAKKRERR